MYCFCWCSSNIAQFDLWALCIVSAGVALPCDTSTALNKRWWVELTDACWRVKCVMKRFRFELSASFYASCLSDHHEAKASRWSESIWPPWGKTSRWSESILLPWGKNHTMIWVYLITMRQKPHDDLSLSDHHVATSSRWSESIWPPWGKTSRWTESIWPPWGKTSRWPESIWPPCGKTSRWTESDSASKGLQAAALDCSWPLSSSVEVRHHWLWRLCWDQPVLRSTARLCFVRKTWRSLFGVFARNMNWPLHSVKLKTWETHASLASQRLYKAVTATAGEKSQAKTTLFPLIGQAWGWGPNAIRVDWSVCEWGSDWLKSSGDGQPGTLKGGLLLQLAQLLI